MRFHVTLLLVVTLVVIGFGLSGCSNQENDVVLSEDSTQEQAIDNTETDDPTAVTIPEVNDDFDVLDESVDESSLDIIENW